MRTTVTLDPDVAAAVEQLRKRGIGVSEAINDLARSGLTVKQARRFFHQRRATLALKIDVTNVGDALEQLDGPAAH